MSPKHVIKLDLIEPTRGVGWMEDGSPNPLPLIASKNGNRWEVYAGTSDEYRGEGSTVDVALRRLAAHVGVTGTAQIEKDWSPGPRVITL
ncbi:hypothetical protein [Nonomuraea typhae]|uniref:Uncharacterized protein n=1 Tax=Nonomuraea typhae TaxID=2603600 RepID=A0ABW7YK52_9ACTN